ncbi:unnamed protein product [Prunus brigantina]
MIVHQNCLLFSFKLHTLKSTGKYKHQHIPFYPSTHLYIYSRRSTYFHIIIKPEKQTQHSQTHT